MASGRERLERRVLLGPDIICRAAAGRSSDPEERWMLGQARTVRAAYVDEVLDRPGDPELLRQIWMMRQPQAVRESFIQAVLNPQLGGS